MGLISPKENQGLRARAKDIVWDYIKSCGNDKACCTFGQMGFSPKRFKKWDPGNLRDLLT
jgi:hypothetical protein